MIARYALAVASSAVASAAGAQPVEAPICTDRPTKANAVCTVAPGRVQLETSLFGWSVTDVGGTRTELLTLGSGFAKFGLTGRSDLQLGFTPVARLRVKDDAGRTRQSGFGDVVIRYKHRLTGDDSKVQLAVIPFVKLPTASAGLGNDKTEGGLAVAVSRTIGTATVTIGPELDLLADADGDGHHAGLINLVNVAVPVATGLTFVGELWSNYNFDPAGTVKQASADAAFAYGVSNDVQLDVGANLGLTRDTPDIEFYAGAAIRF